MEGFAITAEGLAGTCLSRQGEGSLILQMGRLELPVEDRATVDDKASLVLHRARISSLMKAEDLYWK